MIHSTWYYFLCVSGTTAVIPVHHTDFTLCSVALSLEETSVRYDPAKGERFVVVTKCTIPSEGSNQSQSLWRPPLICNAFTSLRFRVVLYDFTL